MNWDAIKYIFQIPLSWYRKIDNWVSNAYGSNYVTVNKDGYFGGLEIGLDIDALDSLIESKGYGKVKSVEGIFPDEVSGNVQLSGFVKTVDDISADISGNVQLSGYVKTIDHELSADEDGNIDLSGFVKSVNGRRPNLSGNVYIPLGAVQTVDHVSPDIDGNIQLNAIRTINGHYGNYEGAISGIVMTINDVEPDENGNIDIELALSDYVKTVNNQAPDENGNVNVSISGFAKSVDNITPDPSTGNITLSGYVKKVNGDIYPDQNGEVTIPYVGSINQILPDEPGGDIELNIVEEVDGIVPVDGVVDFNLDGNEWMKTDANGHIATTNDVPIVYSDLSNNTGYLYNSSGQLTFKNDEYVTLSTAQTITGIKTFDNNIYMTDGNSFTINDLCSGAHTSLMRQGLFITGILPMIHLNHPGTSMADSFIVLNALCSLELNSPVGIELNAPQDKVVLTHQPSMTNPLAVATVGTMTSGFVTLSTDQTVTGKKTFKNQLGTIFQNQNESRTLTIQGCDLNAQCGTNDTYGCNINFIHGSHSAKIWYDTYNNYDNLHIRNTNGQVVLFSNANNVQLAFQPTDTDTSSLAVATVGYCQDKFGKVKTVNGRSPDLSGNVYVPFGVVNSVDHVSPDSSGNVQLNAIRTINGQNGDSVGAFTGVVQSVNNQTPDANGAVQLTGLVETVNNVSPDANGNVELTGIVMSVDGHSPDANGAVSFGLAASKFVKTDASGHLDTTNDNVVTLPSGTTPLTQTQSVVTGVTWNGTQLVIAHRQFVFTNGILTAINTQANTTIDTVTYTP